MPTLDQLLRLLDTSPDDAFVLYGIAMEHAKLGDHRAALPYFDRALEADPANPYHYYHKARSLEALGTIDEAQAVLALGLERAHAASDAQAISETTAYLDQLGSLSS
ncbi:hypothetical protein MNBD_PLANCTO03-1926 [hydrothermal vent metagenome]|uniref:Uncharacterized protein n=1 Tax=hydrothermal vent metagenome TaxID=652676 RepID=A0A3B1DWT2_9ZZZZ